MIELVDKISGRKMIAVLICGIHYDEVDYVLYGIERGEGEVNLFLSKLIKNSSGYVMDDEFENGEKEAFDDIVSDIINQKPIESIKDKGFTFFKDFSLELGNSFDSEKCYVTTNTKKLIKDVMIFYKFISKDMFNGPVVSVAEDKKYFSEGSVSSGVLILLGIIVLVVVFWILFGVLF